MHTFRQDTPLPAPQSGGLRAAFPRGPSASPEQPPPRGPAGTAWHSPRASLPSGLRRPGKRQRRDCSPQYRAQAQPDPPSPRCHGPLVLREPETPPPAQRLGAASSTEPAAVPRRGGAGGRGVAGGTLCSRNLRAGRQVPAGSYEKDYHAPRIPPLGHLVPPRRSPHLSHCRFFAGTPPRRYGRHFLRPCLRSYRNSSVVS